MCGFALILILFARDAWPSTQNNLLLKSVFERPECDARRPNVFAKGATLPDSFSFFRLPAGGPKVSTSAHQQTKIFSSRKNFLRQSHRKASCARDTARAAKHQHTPKHKHNNPTCIYDRYP